MTRLVGDPAQPALCDERSLVERARTDPDAFVALYRAYLPRIHAFAVRRTGSVAVAEDVTSATFERALRALPRFRWTGGGFGPWLFRIAANELVDHHRRTVRSMTVLPALAADREAPPPAEPADDRIRAALAAIRPRYQQAITLRYLAGLSHREAAAALGVTKPVMAVVLHRAMAALRKAMEDDDGS